MDYYKRLLQQHHLRDTTPRRTVVAALLTADRPLFIRELITACPHIDRTTIYRTLETLTDIGVVHIVPFGWKQRYELAAPFRAHESTGGRNAGGTGAQRHGLRVVHRGFSAHPAHDARLVGDGRICAVGGLDAHP